MAILGNSGVLSPRQIGIVEKTYGGKYLFDSCIKVSTGRDERWGYEPRAIFFQPVLKDPSHNHFFAFHFHQGSAWISNGISAIEPFTAFKTADGTVLYSSFRHDCQTYKDTKSGESYMIDGGREYTRWSGNWRNFVTVTVEDLKTGGISFKPFEDSIDELLRPR